jgi:hypothetical protein
MMMRATNDTMNSDTAGEEFKITNRERVIDLCYEQLFEMMMGDYDFAYEISRYGHPGYEYSSDLELLTELDLFNLLDLVLEEGTVVRVPDPPVQGG